MEPDWSTQYYSPEAKTKLEERKHLWSPELQERVSAQWNELFRDVEAALGEDPAGTTGKALAARWKALVGEFTGGDPGIQAGLNQMYRDQGNWPEPQKSSYAVRPEVMAWIMQAMR